MILPGRPKFVCPKLPLMLFCVFLSSCESRTSDPATLFRSSYENLEISQSIELRFVAPNLDPVIVSVWPKDATIRLNADSTHQDLRGDQIVDYRRGVPLFRAIRPATPGEEIRIRLTIESCTSQSTLAVNVESHPLNTRVDETRLSAYELYSEATIDHPTLDQDFWKLREANLHLAADKFTTAGLQHQRLWAEFLSTAIAYFPLSLTEQVRRRAMALKNEALLHSYEDIAVMSTQLYGQSLLFRLSEEGSDAGRELLDASLQAFQEAESLAAKAKLDFQRSWALNNQAIAHHSAGNYPTAIRVYTKALRLGAPLNDRYLDNVINSNLAAAQLQLGNFDQSLLLLSEVIQYQRERDQKTELAFSLQRLGNVFTQSYRFADAIPAYTEAIVLASEANDRELQGYLLLSLATAQAEIGLMRDALQTIERSIPQLELSEEGSGLSRAHHLAANISRSLDNLSKMDQHRNRESPVTEREWSNFYFEAAKDHIRKSQRLPATAKQQQAEAAAHFQKALDGYEKLGMSDQVLLVKLYLCSVGFEQASESCQSDWIVSRSNGLFKSSSPVVAMEANLVAANFLRDQGEYRSALGVLSKFTEEAAKYRTALSGTLHATYWQSRARILEEMMELQITEDLQSASGYRSFALLDQIRNQEFKQLRGAGKTYKAKNQKDLVELLRAIPDDSAIVTYFFSERRLVAWIAKRNGMAIAELRNPQGTASKVISAQSNLRTIGYDALDSDLEKLGEALIDGLPGKLPQQIFLIPGGVLNGFPFEAIRHNGKYLSESHVVTNILTLDHLDRHFGESGHVWQPGTVVIAGNPLNRRGGDPLLPSSAAEMRSVANALGNSKVTMISGESFNRSLFGSSELAGAHLLHISSHASLNLAFPEYSRIALTPAESLDAFITPQDLESLDLEAALVVLSACETTGINDFRFDSNLGFVSEFLNAGADAVLATLFPLPDKFAADFMSSFYANLHSTTGVRAALSATKRDLIASSEPARWAAFQLTLK